ncbi:MAG: TolC family protein [Flavobacteriales bacterium]
MKQLFFVLSVMLMCFSTQAQSKIWSLEQCIQHAFEHNLNLEISKLNLKTNDLEIKKARLAYLPTLNGQVSDNLNFGRSKDGFTNTITTFTQNSLNVGVSTSVTLFQANRLNNTLRLAEKTQESERWTIEKLKNDLALTIANAYLQVLFSKENYETASELLKLTEIQKDRMNIRVENELEPQSKLLEIEAQFYTDQQAKETAFYTLQNARLNLFQLLDIQNYESQDIEDPSLEIPQKLEQFDRDKLVEKAKQHLPEFKKMEVDAEISKLNTELTKASGIPSLTASGSVGTSAFSILNNDGVPKPAYPTQFEDNLAESIGLSLNIPIFNGMQTKIETQKALIRERNLEINQKNTANQTFKAIQSAMFDAQSAFYTYESAVKAYNSSLDVFKNAEERYALDVMNLYDFQQVKNTLFASQSRVVRSKYDYIFKTLILKFYRGEALTLN